MLVRIEPTCSLITPPGSWFYRGDKYSDAGGRTAGPLSGCPTGSQWHPAYSTPSRTAFRADGGQHSAVMVDNGDEILADRKRLESENLSPILNRITDAGYDSTEFLKSSDVYKLTSDSTSAR